MQRLKIEFYSKLPVTRLVLVPVIELIDILENIIINDIRKKFPDVWNILILLYVHMNPKIRRSLLKYCDEGIYLIEQDFKKIEKNLSYILFGYKDGVPYERLADIKQLCQVASRLSASLQQLNSDLTQIENQQLSDADFTKAVAVLHVDLIAFNKELLASLQELQVYVEKSGCMGRKIEKKIFQGEKYTAETLAKYYADPITIYHDQCIKPIIQSRARTQQIMREQMPLIKTNTDLKIVIRMHEVEISKQQAVIKLVENQRKAAQEIIARQHHFIFAQGKEIGKLKATNQSLEKELKRKPSRFQGRMK